MADDELDAFFDEVSEVEAVAKQNEEESEEAPKGKVAKSMEEANKDSLPPPSKKAKISNGESQPLKPSLGVVVASSTPVASGGGVISAIPVASAPAQVIVGNGGPSQSSSSFVTTIKPIGPMTSSSSSLPPQKTGSSSSYGGPQPFQKQPLPIVGPQPPPPPPPIPQQYNPSQKINGHKQPASKVHKRSAAGQTWVDPTLEEWPENDYRIFVGNLAKDVNDKELYEHFASKFQSVAMAKVIRDGKGITKCYGFVSFMEPMECAKAMREMDQTWLSSRPIRVKRSDWKDRDFKVVKQKERKFAKKQKRWG